MSDLRDPLDDLLADVPAYVVPDARSAWAAGARRRTRHRVAVVACVAVVIALAAGLATWLPRTAEPQPANGEGVDGYPTRVDQPWLDRDLPDDSGPLAGALMADGGPRAVSASGRVWSLPQEMRATGYPVALSADGTKLAYLQGGRRFEVHDLAAGSVTVAKGVGDGQYNTRVEAQAWGDFWIGSQAPAFWSPDNATVFVLGSTADISGTESEALLIGADGVTTAVRAPDERHAAAWPAGWASSDELVWLLADYPHEPARWATAVVTTTAGDEVRRIELAVPKGLGGLSQWSGSVSPDGSRLLVAPSGGGDARVYSLSDGTVVDNLPVEFPECQTSWAGDEPRPANSGSDVVAVRNADGSPQVTVDPSFGSSCALWASDALAGSAHQGLAGRLFGDSNSWLSWHWQEMALLALGAVAAGSVLLVVLRIRRRRVHRLG